MRILFIFFIFLLISSAQGQGNIIVRGNWKDADVNEISLFFLEDATIYKSTTITSEIDSLNGAFYFSVPSNHPTKLQLLNERFLALPDDTITISIEKNEKGVASLNFLDSLERESSFFSLLEKSVRRFDSRGLFEKDSSIQRYKKDAVTHYNAALDFFRVHSVNYSAAGKLLIKELVTISYYDDLIYPLSSRKITKAQLPPDYFKGVDISLLNKAELLPFREYILFLSYFNYCFYGTLPPKGKYYDSVYVNSNIISAHANFAGETKDNLLLLIYDGLVKNGTTKNKTQVEGLFNYLSAAFKNDLLRAEEIKEMKLKFDILGKPFPKKILAQQLRSPEGKSVPLSNALPPGKIVFIDFWASWCKPCMEEMPQEQQLISELESSGIEFIFISWDKNEEAWKKAMKKINIKENHYQLAEGTKSDLIRYLNFVTIPRYMVINKAGALINYDAPRPSDILKDKSKLIDLVK